MTRTKRTKKNSQTTSILVCTTTVVNGDSAETSQLKFPDTDNSIFLSVTCVSLEYAFCENKIKR